jgi:hypothetical protein
MNSVSLFVICRNAGYNQVSLPAKAMLLHSTLNCTSQFKMTRFRHVRRVIQPFLSPVRPMVCLFVCAWLAIMQPGMSIYSVISPEVHAEIDKELYGQTPDGHTLPGHEEHAPHDHPANQGTAVPDSTYINPFDAAFYHALFEPTQRPALNGQRLETAIFARSITIEPPEQPPRA